MYSLLLAQIKNLDYKYFHNIGNMHLIVVHILYV